jgi:hypothetical protein
MENLFFSFLLWEMELFERELATSSLELYGLSAQRLRLTSTTTGPAKAQPREV